MAPDPAEKPVRVFLIGLGAVARQYYVPALKELERINQTRLVAVFDPQPAQVEIVRREFGQFSFVSPHQASPELIDLAIVASPPCFHAQQSVELLKQGINVLCEKPMSTSVNDAQSMIRQAAESGRILAVGLWRRFFPAIETMKQMLDSGLFGQVLSFQFVEGANFSWPAVSASFFKKEQAGGGVLIDIGSHVIDLAILLFGYPEEFDYADDAMGGVEANCRIIASFKHGIAGEIKLSRDWDMSNCLRIICENGWISWQVGQSNQLSFGFNGISNAFLSGLYAKRWMDGQPELGNLSYNYQQAFISQILNVVNAVRMQSKPLIDGQEGLTSLRFIEACYSRRRLLSMPWFSESEERQAGKLSAKKMSC